MLNYSEILPHKLVLIDGEPYEVLDAHVFQKQQRRPVNAAKLKHVISGKVVEMTFQQSDKAHEAEIGTREIKYLFENRGEHWFCDPVNPKDRFALDEVALGNGVKFIKVNDIVEARVFNEKIFALNLPAKVELKVTESAPAVRGNTSGNATKLVKLETGATVNVPMFINEGDILRINTETGEYTERVEKA